MKQNLINVKPLICPTKGWGEYVNEEANDEFKRIGLGDDNRDAASTTFWVSVLLLCHLFLI